MKSDPINRKQYGVMLLAMLNDNYDVVLMKPEGCVICLLDDNGTDAQRLLDKVTSYAALVGLHLNVGKTKFCAHDTTRSSTSMVKN